MTLPVMPLTVPCSPVSVPALLNPPPFVEAAGVADGGMGGVGTVLAGRVGFPVGTSLGGRGVMGGVGTPLAATLVTAVAVPASAAVGIP
jgi:hypothetical protein